MVTAPTIVNNKRHSNHNGSGGNGGGCNRKNNNSNQPKVFRFRHNTFPPNVRSDNVKYYCWLYRQDCNHNDNAFTYMVQGHVPNTTTRIGTNINPANCKRVMFPLQVGLIGRVKARAMATGGTDDGCGNQTPHMPTWNHQSTMGMAMGGALTMMTPQLMQPQMMQPYMIMQQHQPMVQQPVMQPAQGQQMGMQAI